MFASVMFFSLALVLVPSAVHSYSLFNKIKSDDGTAVEDSLSRSNTAGSNGKNSPSHPFDHSSLPPTEVTLSTGLFHTCAITHRTGVDCGSATCGPVKCWGHNNRGQATPPPGVMFQQLSSGGFFTCGIKPGGKVACWGDIDHPPKSLEALSREERSNVEHARRIQRAAVGAAHTSVTHVNGGGYYVQVSSGMRHACAISKDSEVQCWGRNDFGEGCPPGGAFVQVSAGNSFTCGVRTNGSVQCWGKNDAGQSAPPPYPEHVFRQISTSVGGDHACGILLDAFSQRATDVRCWGNNGRGQSERQDGAVGTFLQVSAGTRTTCAIRAKTDSAIDGDDADDASTVIHCWGNRAHALLDHFATTQDDTYQQIQMGQDHACALASSLTGNTGAGSLQCWWMAGADFDAHRIPVGLEMVG